MTSPEQACVLLKDGAVIPPVSVLPQRINPGGLSDERRNYLYREIRQFCNPGTEDLVAPVPQVTIVSNVTSAMLCNKINWL